MVFAFLGIKTPFFNCVRVIFYYNAKMRLSLLFNLSLYSVNLMKEEGKRKMLKKCPKASLHSIVYIYLECLLTRPRVYVDITFFSGNSRQR